MKRTTVNDATDWFQFGQSTSDTLYDFDIGELTSSSWNKYPTMYKFIGVHLEMDLTEET